MFVANRKLRTDGFVLIEVLIACTISILIIYSLFTFFVDSQRVFEADVYMRKSLHDVRSLSDLLADDINKAGYIGCAKLTSQSEITNDTEISFSINTRLHGGDNEISIIHASEASDSIVAINADGSSITISGDIVFEAHDILIISDCDHVEVINVNHVNKLGDKQILTPQIPLKNKFNSYAEISKLIINHYYLRPSKKIKNAFSLYLANINGEADEIIDGLAYLQFKYSINTPSGLQDLSAAEILDWSKVAGVDMKFKFNNPVMDNRWDVYAAI